MWTTLVLSAGSLKEVEAFISSVFQCTNEALVDEIVRGVCNFFGSVSLQQNFEMADQYYSLVTAQFYLASKGKYILEV